MDSLLATYASSDEDEQEVEQERSESSACQTSTSLSSSLPPPKSSSSSSSSLFSFLPPPKPHPPNRPSQTLSLPTPSKPTTQFHKKEQENQPQSQTRETPIPASSSSIFSFLPPPKSKNSDPFALANLSSASNPKPKKIIHLKLPNSSRRKSEDSDDDDKEREGKKKAVESVTETASVKSFLSSIPAPKNSSTLGSLPSAAGSGRRSIIEADVTTSFDPDAAYSSNTDGGVSDNGQVVEGLSSASFGDAGNSAQYVVESSGGGDTSSWANYENYEGYAGYGNYDYNGQYESNWGDGSTTVAPSDGAGNFESVVKVPGKRGRNDVPQEILEVNQDELIKNRPREDQVKLTGIAFGPSYQPVSTKGKPSKLMKRKHQISSLYFDMRQKEMELAERRSRGFLTKAETQAKYGW